MAPKMPLSSDTAPLEALRTGDTAFGIAARVGDVLLQQPTFRHLPGE